MRRADFMGEGDDAPVLVKVLHNLARLAHRIDVAPDLSGPRLTPGRAGTLDNAVERDIFTDGVNTCLGVRMFNTTLLSEQGVSAPSAVESTRQRPVTGERTTGHCRQRNGAHHREARLRLRRGHATLSPR